MGVPLLSLLFNRYTYGMNNPFRYLDPSGYLGELMENVGGDKDPEKMPTPKARDTQNTQNNAAKGTDKTVTEREDPSETKAESAPSEFTEEQLDDHVYRAKLWAQGQKTKDYSDYNRYISDSKMRVFKPLAAIVTAITLGTAGAMAAVWGCVSNPIVCNQIVVDGVEIVSEVSLTGQGSLVGGTLGVAAYEALKWFNSPKATPEFTQEQLDSSYYGATLTRNGRWKKYNRWFRAR